MLKESVAASMVYETEGRIIMCDLCVRFACAVTVCHVNIL